MRKRILETAEVERPGPRPNELDIQNIATALVSSESTTNPIEHAFDGHRGPGASRWIAATGGEQTLILEFDAPQQIRRILLEVEETEVARTQELTISVSTDGGQRYRELLRQEYNFSPSGTSFEREEWPVEVNGVTHLRLWIKPEKGGAPYLATITTLALESG